MEDEFQTIWLFDTDTTYAQQRAYVHLAGKVLGGMMLTPCGNYMVYPLGSILVVRSMTGKNRQAFLEGHTADISCVAMSVDGSRIVSGQVRFTYTFR